MMRGAGGALAMAFAALLVCCSADPHQEQDVSGSEHNSGERYDASGHKTRTLDAPGSGNLVREVREVRHAGYVPYLISRRYDFASPYGGKREPWPLAPIEFGGYYGDGLPKRNFDEIDRSGLDTFVKKRNFDEIDRSRLPFPHTAKRFYHLYGPNYLDIDNPVSSLDRNHNFDEIDRSGLDTFVTKRNFDEIDRSTLPFPHKRFYHLYGPKYLNIDAPVSSSDKKRNRPEYPMDEIDLSHFPVGSKRSQDNYSLVPRNL